ncbi:uncharacterized protein Tco025E_09058 [Trypanosoma conorhini]|uniref:Uncharacterized protein n=1 Tax=Trypanosoma conorhini TaxID=83891 RepID=A0A3R7LMP5_9TRYP|nr:uncharacterized protein Tco025E_09058 [Trypanosoma conorhini]RNE99996.1 hypothetical protein Tco025E_09058 [Trypanosoma conorhini]
MLVEAGAGNRMGFRPMQPEETRNPTGSPSTAALGDSFATGYTLFQQSAAADTASCHSRWSNNEGGSPSTFPSRSSRRTEGLLTSSYNSSAELSATRGAPLVFPPGETRSLEQALPPPSDRYTGSVEEARYNPNAASGSGPGGSVYFMNTPLQPWKSSGGGVYSMTGGATTEFNRGGQTTGASSFLGCGDAPTPSVVPRAGAASISVGAAGTATLGQRSPLEAQQQRSWSTVEPPRAVTSSSLYFLTFDGERHLKEKTLRFKMLPSPVPFETFFAETHSRTSPECVSQYQSTMLRWYKRIVPAQENTRARVRQRCPSPPKSLLREAALPDAAELQSWAEQCCRWWDETSRKRTRRGHRGGKTLGSAGSTPMPAAQQQRANEPARLAGENKPQTIGTPLLLPSAADVSERAPSDDTDHAWMKWVENKLEETFLMEE